MGSVAILYRVEGVVLIGTQSGEILAMSDEVFDSSYAERSNGDVKSIDMRQEGLMSVERDLLYRLERSSATDVRPAEISVRVAFEQWDFHVQASFVEAAGLWIVWGVERTIGG